MSDTRARILSHATEVLTSVGYAAFTVAAVRDALGLSSGSMFHAFPSKQALAAAVYVEGMADYQQVALAALESASDPESAVRALIAAHLTWVEKHRSLAGFLFTTLPDEVMELAQQPLSDHNSAFFTRLSGLFRSASSAGLMGRVEWPLAHALCIGPAQEYCRKWTRGAAARPPREAIGTLQKAALAALASTRSARSTRPRRRRPQRGKARSHTA